MEPYDDAAIRTLYHQLLASWATGNGAAYAAHFAEDADYIIASGVLEHGRAEIAAGHQAIFDTWAKHTRLTGQILRLRMLTPDIALLIATGAVLMPGQADADPSERTLYSLVAQKVAGRWTFIAYQNTPVQAFAAA